MTGYVLSCCSTVDLKKEYLASRDIRTVCFRYEIDGEQYADDFGATMSAGDFYRRMEEGAQTRTSRLNIHDYKEYFEPFLREGLDILHISFSSGLTGSIDSARMAARELEEAYPGRKIVVLDSLAASSGYGLLMDMAADLRDRGLSLEETAARIEEEKLTVQHWFYSTTLKYYVRGGRISRAAGMIGEALGVCPLLRVDEEGHLVPVEKIRPRKRVREAILRRMEENAAGGTDYADRCYISHSACPEDAAALAEEVEKRFPNLRGRVSIQEIGVIIGSHTGPGTVALFFRGKRRDGK